MSSRSAIDDDMCFDVIVIEVEGRIARVPRRLFAGSSVFQDMLALPQARGTIVDGSDDKHPLKLQGIKYGAFKAFVRVAMTIEIRSPFPSLSCSELASVYDLTCLWDMYQTRDSIIQRCHALFGDELADKQLYLAQRFHQPDWILPGLDYLIGRREPLSREEMEELGLDLSARIWSIRETRMKFLVVAIESQRTVVPWTGTREERGGILEICMSQSGMAID